MAIGGMGGKGDTGNAYTYNPNWCGNKLPCGWCKELGMMCTLEGATYPNQPFTCGTEITFNAKEGKQS